MLYFGDAAGYLVALDTESGRRKWKYHLPRVVLGARTVTGALALGAKRTLYAATMDGTLAAITTSEPEVFYFRLYRRSQYAGPSLPGVDRRVSNNGHIFFPPIITLEGTLYFGSSSSGDFPQNDTARNRSGMSATLIGGNKLNAVEAAGNILGSFDTGGAVQGMPALGPDGTIFAGSEYGNMYAVSSDGMQKWAFATRGPVRSSPVFGPDAAIYFGSADSTLYALNDDGTERLRVAASCVIETDPAIRPDGTIYVGSHEHFFYAIRPDGSLAWKFETGDLIWGSSAAIDAEGNLYFGSFDHNLYALAASGELKWQLATNDQIFASPALAPDGMLYVGSKDGNLYAIGHVATGSESSGTPVPAAYQLWQNYPNPFNPSTTIRYALPKAGQVRLALYSLLGQRVWSMQRRHASPGVYAITWNGRDDRDRPVASGVYLLQMQAGDFVQTRKLVLMK